jgi:pimeloyl-ACP methyl ester carboxylesterase
LEGYEPLAAAGYHVVAPDQRGYNARANIKQTMLTET